MMTNKWLFFLIMPLHVFADELILSDISNGCLNNLNADTFFLATFTPNQYHCSMGYYVPMNNDGCVVCPEYYDCDGGTFYFNKKYDQGNRFKTQITENITSGCKTDFVNASNSTANIIPVFVPNVYTCNPGYYMPANYDGCQLCLADSYCAGGTYTFNETVTQGIVSCMSGLYAPAGMWESSQCGRILHIGDEVVYLHQTKKTSPALHVDVDNDGVADFFGNVTTLDVPMTRGTQRKLKINYNNITYSVYDDSLDLTQYQN